MIQPAHTTSLNRCSARITRPIAIADVIVPGHDNVQLNPVSRR
ncbi:MAG: hypothetical protein AAF823_01295 [Planctomycetota bacterium]